MIIKVTLKRIGDESSIFKGTVMLHSLDREQLMKHSLFASYRNSLQMDPSISSLTTKLVSQQIPKMVVVSHSLQTL